MNLRELLASVSPEALQEAQVKPLAQALHASEGAGAPLMVRLFTAVGTWIGASLAAFFFAALELYEVVPVALGLGVGLFVLAMRMASDQTRSLARTQLIWAMCLGAHGLFLGAMAEMDVGSQTIALIWTLLNIITMLLIRVPSFQMASAVAAVGFGTWFMVEFDFRFAALVVAVPVSVLAVSAWMHESRWASRLGRTWAALAYGLPVASAIPLTIAALEPGFHSESAANVGGPLASLVVLALVGWVLFRAKMELEGRGEKVPERAYALGLIAVFVALIGRNVPGLTLSLLWMLVAHLRRSRPLEGIAMAQLSGFLFFFYYQLETTLLLKSLWVLASGALILASAYLARPGADRPGVAVHERRARWLPAAVLVLLTSGIVSYAVVSKEAVVRDGTRVLLPLGVRDPRSLIQGDYMVLNYELANEMRTAHGDLAVIERHGRVVLQLDEQRVAHFVRLDRGEPPAEGQVALEYRVRDSWRGSVRVGAESFLFEEGSAHLYQNAAFGEVVVADDGAVVLVGLRDAERRVLGVQLHPED